MAPENGRPTPKTARPGPSNPRRPKASNSATPATAGGNTTGSWVTVSSTRQVRPRLRAINHASGVPPRTISTRLASVVVMVSRIAGATSGSRRPRSSSAGDDVKSNPAIGSRTSSSSAPERVPRATGQAIAIRRSRPRRTSVCSATGSDKG